MIMRGEARIRAGFWYGRGMNRRHVLVVDDDPDVRGLVVQLLERAGYEITVASDGREGVRALYEVRPDLVVLDLTMPRMDGWQALERIREVSDVPVLVLTGRSAELETVRGLKAGADDYVTKPFRRQELLARVEALLRRGTPRERAPETYEDELLRIDFPQRAVMVAGQPVTLTPTEFRLLTTLVRHANQVLSREQILELVWSDPYAVSLDQVKLYVGYLRRKLGAGGARVPIETVRGFGYRYAPP
jgi:DNA-binding response OmpR family regulator